MFALTYVKKIIHIGKSYVICCPYFASQYSPVPNCKGVGGEITGEGRNVQKNLKMGGGAMKRGVNNF